MLFKRFDRTPLNQVVQEACLLVVHSTDIILFVFLYQNLSDTSHRVKFTNKSFNSSIAFWCCGVQRNCIPFFKSWFRGAATTLKFGINFRNQFNMPINRRNSLMFLGGGQALMASTLSLGALFPPLIFHVPDRYIFAEQMYISQGQVLIRHP